MILVFKKKRLTNDDPEEIQKTEKVHPSENEKSFDGITFKQGIIFLRCP